MSSTLIFSGGIRVGQLASAPSAPQNGTLYYNTADNALYVYRNSNWRKLVDDDSLLSLLDAADVVFDATGLIHTSAIDVQTAISDLDAAIGLLDSTPSNYTAADPTVVADHLVGIDTALSAALSSEFADSVFRINDNVDPTKQIAFEASGVATATTRTITMPDANVDLGDIAPLVTLSGVAAKSTHLGTFTGSIISNDQTVKAALQDLETYIEGLPSPMVYKGTWNASTNSPTLADGVGSQGDVYRVTVAGTQDLGSGNISFEVGDSVVYNGTTWEKWDMTDAVTSVNGMTGAVVLDLDDLGDVNAPSPTDGQVLTWDNNAQEWIASTPAAGYTDEEAQDAVGNILDDGTNGDIEFTYDDPTPRISADIKDGAVVSAKLDDNLTLQGTVSRAADLAGSNMVEEQYVHATALASSQTDTVMSSFTFAHATYDGVEITYRLKEATSNAVRIGTLRIVTDGTNVSINDSYVETAATGISFSAVVSGSDVNIRYSSGANSATLRADVKRIRA